MIIYRALIATIASLSAVPVMATERYTIDPRHTYPVFEVSHLGFSVQHGRFNRTSGTIELDRTTDSGRIDVVVDVASLDMGLEDWDKHLLNEEFLHVERYPTITFVSEDLEFDGDTLIAARGILTLHGVSRPVTLEVHGFKCGSHPMNQKALCGANAKLRIKRSDFGMTSYIPGVGDEVSIHVSVEAYRNE